MRRGQWHSTLIRELTILIKHSYNGEKTVYFGLKTHLEKNLAMRSKCGWWKQRYVKIVILNSGSL